MFYNVIMSKKKKDEKKKDEEKESRWSAISMEIKKSIVAVLLVGLAIVMLLASFDMAGPAGDLIFNGLYGLLGVGYYILPAVALVIALVFMLAEEVKFLSPTFIGATILIISTLGLIDIIFPEKAGFLGNTLGLIETPFGYIASLVITSIITIASLSLTLNIPIKIKLKKKEEDDPKEADEEKELDIKEPLATPAVSSPPQVEGDKTAPEPEPEKKSNVKTNAKSAVLKNYQAPPPSLLKASIEKPTAGDLRANANIIKRTLDSFGISVEMGEINIGPKVTRYTLKPAEGIKLTRIIALNQDLSLALAVHPLRIEAPIPGKSLVGIEIPNKSAAIVRVGSLIAYPEFAKASPLTFILGRDVNGNPISVNIAKMPHMLISGSTGSGKSIFIHSLIVSLLCKNSPELLRLVLIDPKRVELSVYNGIPHLISPVVTDGKKAINVFRWAIQEMENRYETLLKAGARDIESYNKSAKEETMPYLLVVVDELADLMAAYGREVESAIVRLAQMARATGIHLVLATQRPSVNVITGLIKANITARAALQVASQVDSRTILDMAGAEKLLGGGDMLFVSSEFSKPKRIQGAFITEKEISQVANYIIDNNKDTAEEETEDGISADNSSLISSPEMNPENFNKNETKKNEIDFDNFSPSQEEEEDELYNPAVTTVRQAQKASASLLQRRLKIGYARAARLLDIMEENGIISAGDGAKPREVYISEDS